MIASTFLAGLIDRTPPALIVLACLALAAWLVWLAFQRTHHERAAAIKAVL